MKNLCVMTDKNVMALPGMKTIVNSLHNSGINFDVYSNVSIEPTDKRCARCVGIDFFMHSMVISHCRLSVFRLYMREKERMSA